MVFLEQSRVTGRWTVRNRASMSAKGRAAAISHLLVREYARVGAFHDLIDAAPGRPPHTNASGHEHAEHDPRR